MKSNRKGGGLKGLLVAHCEKGIAALLVGLAGYLVYASLSVQGEKRQVAELQSKVSSTTTAYNDVTWSEVVENNKDDVKLAYDVGEGKIEQIPFDTYATSPQGWAPPVVPPTVDRPDPKLLVAEELHGSATTGLFAFVNEEIQKERALQEAREAAELEDQQRRESERSAEGNNPLAGGIGPRGMTGEDETFGGKRRPVGGSMMQMEAGVQTQGDELIQQLSCAVVLAKAPSKKQYEVYQEAFEEARGYSELGDTPQYLGYFVQRAEVRDGKQGKWVDVPVTDGQLAGQKFPFVSGNYLDRVVRDWASGQEDPMDARYQDYALTTPLPPLVGAGWRQDEIVHPAVPLQVDSDAEAEEEARKLETEGIDGDEPDDEEGGFDSGTDAGPGGMGMGRGGMEGGMRGGMGGMRGGMGGMPGGMRGAGGMPGGMRGGMGGMRGGMGGMGGGASRSGGPSEFNPEIPAKMVRFFDFTVKPGRQYRYRVRLVLRDPNAGIERRFLAREVVERIDSFKKPRVHREADWSDPSPVISVPMAGTVSIVDAKAPKKGSAAEGTLNLLVQSYAVDESGRAQQAGVKKTFRRGSVMNSTEDTEVVTADRQWIEKVKDFDLNTGITLVDFRGGDEVAQGLKRPVRALYMDAGGRLFVRNELDDAETVESYKATFEDEGTGEGGMMMPGMGRGGMPPGMGRGGGPGMGAPGGGRGR
ncbi:MAG: hypothetical protein ACRCT8_15225 [Lacipirellulaceae bacterium]